MPQSTREAFFDLLSQEATPFVIGADERPTLELPLWQWPEQSYQHQKDLADTAGSPL